MRHHFKKTAALSCLAFLLQGAYATGIPNNSDPTTFLGPTLRLGATSTISDTWAYSLLGEAGLRNFRVGATVGTKIADDQYFKISADYLWQDINFAFFSGNSEQWVKQISLGTAYQYDLLGYMYDPELNLNAYVSHAPSRNLGTYTGTYVNSAGVTDTYSDARRIAGANAGGISPGLSISAWQGGRIGAGLNYDDVHYNEEYGHLNQNALGFGGTVYLKQAITNDVSLYASAAVRAPFNNYYADVEWDHFQWYGDWALGAFGDYSDGKNTLPNTWDVGLSAIYHLDLRCPVAQPRTNVKGELDYKGEAVLSPVADNLLAWTSVPAVYLPQVLAIADPSVSTGCTVGAPTFITPFVNNISVISGAPVTVILASAPHFHGAITHYSVTSTETGLPSPANSVTINPSTGVITIHFSGVDPGTFSITVFATGTCGTVASNTFTQTAAGIT